MTWSEQAWNSIEPIYDTILAMPFIKELADGSLPKEKFQFYMAQDSIYLEHFGRALSTIASKARNIEDALAFNRFAEGAIVAENALHSSYFVDFGVSDRGVPEPACHHYIHYLKSTVTFESVEIGMAAVLPCFWIYKKVGDYIYQNQNTENNPYKKWIDMYAGEEFGDSVNQAISICDKAGANTTDEVRTLMTEAFITASRLEYDFWDGAYRLRKW